MKKRFTVTKRIATILPVLIGLWIFTANTTVTLANADSITVGPGQGVNFEQVDFVFSAVTQENSDWGRISANPELLSSSTDISSGFLNIFSDAGWVVQNLPVDVNYGTVTTYFSLGLSTPTDVSELSAHIEFASSPQDDFSDGERGDFDVGVALWNAEGAGDSQTAVIGEAPPPNLIQFRPRGKNTKHTQPNAVNVQTAKNQCFPMSIANSLQYLEDRFGVNVPHDHKPGLKGDDSLVGQLDMEADRRAPARNDGDGVWFTPMLKGKFSYLKKNGLKNKLIHKHQGRGYGNPPDEALPNGDFRSSGIKSKDRGAKVTFKFICDEIKKGEDVELVFSYDDNNGNPTGGHAVRVFECGKTKGRPWIGYLHDRLQTNNDPNDKEGLEKVRQHIKDIDGDGILNLGSKNREIRFVLSESSKKKPR